MNSTGNFTPTKLKQNSEIIFTIKHKLIETSQVLQVAQQKMMFWKWNTTFFSLESSFKGQESTFTPVLVNCLNHSNALFPL